MSIIKYLYKFIKIGRCNINDITIKLILKKEWPYLTKLIIGNTKNKNLDTNLLTYKTIKQIISKDW